MQDAIIDILTKVSATTPAEVTDDDVKQLVIYYATIVRDPDLTTAQEEQVKATWRNWPPELYNRFSLLTREYDDPRTVFWLRPATINIRYGI